MHPTDKIVGSLRDLSQRCSLLRRSHAKIVLTSGCFDLLHGGHLEYLCEASERGCLVVGINSNDFVRKLKGEGRPVRNQEDRAFLIAGFFMVHLVSVFDDDRDLIDAVRPDIYIASNTSHVRIGDDAARLSILRHIGSDIIELGSNKSDSTTEMIRRLMV